MLSLKSPNKTKIVPTLFSTIGQCMSKKKTVRVAFLCFVFLCDLLLVVKLFKIYYILFSNELLFACRHVKISETFENS